MASASESSAAPSANHPTANVSHMHSSLPEGHPPIPGMPLDATSCPYHADNDPAITNQKPASASTADSPLNNMPITPNQTPAKDQKELLSIDREVSTIPMGGKHDGKYWVYPSQQMFYNAMKRKNWDPAEKDMGVVVPIHNIVNEECWRKILEWEGMHKTSCDQPKLVKFIGKPREYTPKARILNLFGYKLPFDRHDWVVDRCGKEVRYVIDFYGGNTGGISFFLDVRPAISWDGLGDRWRRFWKTGTGLF